MSSRRSAALVYNPAAGRRRETQLLDRILAVLDRSGWRTEAHATDAPGAATRIARELATSGLVDAVFALGGDGTQREVAAGLHGTDVALAPLPGGTTNVLAHCLGVPARPLAAARCLAGAPRRELAVGRLEGEPFLMMASAGLDARIMDEVSGKAKARWGRAAVLAQGFASWRRHPFRPIRVTWDGRSIEAPFVALCNIPHYAGRFVMAPDARIDRSSLELVAHCGSGRWTALGFALSLLIGRHLGRRDVVHATVDAVTLEGPPEVHLQLDGDPCSLRLPVRISVDPRPLAILAPAPPSA